MQKANILILIILGFIVVAAAIFGWMMSSKSFTFSDGSAIDGSLSFNYPVNMVNDDSSETLITGTENWKMVGQLTDNNNSILIQKALGLSPSDSSDEEDAVREHGGQIISKIDETNPNGIKVFKSITTIPDSDGTTIIYYEMLFQNNNGATYCIQVYGHDQASINETADIVFNSLKFSENSFLNQLFQMF